MRHDTAGDPIMGLKWTRNTTKKLAAELAQYRIYVCPNTVGRLLKGLDFHIDAEGRAIPCGIYDEQQNHGYVFIGTSYETPAFAVDSIVERWCGVGRECYPQARELLILADCGGSNGYRSRVWKYRLCRQLCEPYNLSVAVCHYPPGASKWNPIEYRLFSEISKNWAGQPLTSYETIMKYIRTTQTEAGLTVDAQLVNTVYEKGERVSNAQMATIPLVKNERLPD